MEAGRFNGEVGVRSRLLRAAAVLLATALQSAALAGRPLEPTSASGQEPAPAPRRPRSRHPIADSVERSVDRVLKAHRRLCGPADQQGVPCFPVTVAVEGPRFSVAEALRRYRVDGREPTGAPSNSEMLEQLSGRPATSPPITFLSIDPVCTAKSLIRSLSGKPNTFYLYRFSDRQGDRPLLTDRELNPESYASRPDVHYEFLGKFSGECEAIAAWRKALRQSEPKPADDPRPPQAAPTRAPGEEEAPPP
jgi:hypothetical protein